MALWLLAQLGLNGIVAGSLYAVLAISFAMIYAPTKTFHFARGNVYVFSAYFLYQFSMVWGWPLPAAIPAALLGAALMGVLVDRVVYTPLRKSGAGVMQILLGAFGTYIVLQNVLLLIWKSDPRTVRVPETLKNGMPFGLLTPPRWTRSASAPCGDCVGACVANLLKSSEGHRSTRSRAQARLAHALTKWPESRGRSSGTTLALQAGEVSGCAIEPDGRAEPALRKRRRAMPKYVIEREIPGIGGWSAEQTQEASKKSRAVLGELGPAIQWLQSYVTADKLYCVYIAPSPDLIEEHAARGGFPCNRVSPVRAVIDPTTAEQ
jgi:hypothetical protein